eukprot:scaffold188655_cov37-Prasinocladus_malaysianus.AAC.1
MDGQRQAVCEELFRATEGDPMEELMDLLASGVSFHHAGLQWLTGPANCNLLGRTGASHQKKGMLWNPLIEQ